MEAPQVLMCGADASVKAMKIYDMKLLTLAYLGLLDRSSSRSLLNLHCQKVGNDRPRSLLKRIKVHKIMAAAEQLVKLCSSFLNSCSYQ